MSYEPYYLDVYMVDGQTLRCPFVTSERRREMVVGINRVWKSGVRSYVQLTDPENTHSINTDHIVRLKEVGT